MIPDVSSCVCGDSGEIISSFRINTHRKHQGLTHRCVVKGFFLDGGSTIGFRGKQYLHFIRATHGRGNDCTTASACNRIGIRHNAFGLRLAVFHACADTALKRGFASIFCIDKGLEALGVGINGRSCAGSCALPQRFSC